MIAVIVMTVVGVLRIMVKRRLLAPLITLSDPMLLPFAFASGVVLVVCLLSAVRSFRIARRSGSDDQGVRGCLSFYVVAIITCGCLLGIGIGFHIRLLVIFVTCVTVIPAIILMIEAIWKNAAG